jgi:hypothetical protein
VRLPSFLGPFKEVTAGPVEPPEEASSQEQGARSKHLSVPIVRPLPTEWCWAATAAAIASFYALVDNVGRVLTACQVATECLFTPCCPDPADPADPRNREYALEGALSAVGHLAQDPVMGALDFATIVREIDGDRPVCCHIAWDTSNPDNGHFNAIVGYDSGDQDVDICDCLYGNQTLPYATFTNAYEGKGTWDWTYLTK